jgi:hypothetical protein
VGRECKLISNTYDLFRSAATAHDLLARIIREGEEI